MPAHVGTDPLEDRIERLAAGIVDGRSLDRAVEPDEARLEPGPADVDTDQVALRGRAGRWPRSPDTRWGVDR